MHRDARELEHASFRIGDATTIHFAEQLRSCLAQAMPFLSHVTGM